MDRCFLSRTAGANLCVVVLVSSYLNAGSIYSFDNDSPVIVPFKHKKHLSRFDSAFDRVFDILKR